jgi:hypothetical protein
MMENVHQRQRGATTQSEDTEGVIQLANNDHVVSNIKKHIDIKHHYIRELVDAMTLAVKLVCTTYMLAGGLTKARPKPKHTMIFMRCMGTAPSGD